MANLAFALVDSTFEPFRAGELLVKPAGENWEKQAYFALRRAVFRTNNNCWHRTRTVTTSRPSPSSPWRATAAWPIKWWGRYESISLNLGCGLAGACALRRPIAGTA